MEGIEISCSPQEEQAIAQLAEGEEEKEEQQQVVPYSIERIKKKKLVASKPILPFHIVNMVRDYNESDQKLSILLLATQYKIGGNKTVIMGYDPVTLEAKIGIMSEKRQIVFSPAEYREMNADGTLWTVLQNPKKFSRKSKTFGEISLRVTSIKHVPHVVFRDKKQNACFSLNSVEINSLFKLQTLIDSALFTLTMNQLNVYNFINTLLKRHEDVGFYMKFDDFVLPVNPVHGIDYFRLFMEYPMFNKLEEKPIPTSLPPGSMFTV